MDRFSKFHPLVSFSFFTGVMAITVFFTNSFLPAASFIAAFLYSVKLKGRNSVKFLIKFIIPIVLFAAVFNMLFYRRGETVLFYVKEISFTLEGLVSGLLTGVMIGAVMLWFSCYNEVITSDKFMALFGGLAPNLALLVSMILRFIPHMAKTAQEIKDAQTGLGIESKGLKNALNRFSALISVSLEKSIETADSMRARGFGKKKRGFYSAFDFRITDTAAAAIIILSAVLLFLTSIKDYPQISLNSGIRINNNSVLLAAFSAFSLFPLLADLTEDVKWLLLKSKI